MEPVRLGVIGCGVMGNKHLATASAMPGRYEVAAVADLIEERVQKAKADYGAAKAYKSGEALISRARDVEMVILAFPARDRARLAIKAFRRGKHVLTEKPVAMNAREVRRMIKARGPLTGGCCQSRYRFYSHAEAAAKFISTGALGEIRLVRARELRQAGPPPAKTPPDWRLIRALNGGGILMNWGCYDLDYVLGLLGWSVKAEVALARTWRAPPQLEGHIAPGSDAETHFAALIGCRGGAAIVFERGEYMPCANDEGWQIIGTRGSLKLKMTVGKGKQIVFDEATTEQGVVSRVIWEGDEDWGDVSTALLEDFAGAVRGGRQPRAGLEEALAVQEISDAIYASAARGTAVRIK